MSKLIRNSAHKLDGYLFYGLSAIADGCTHEEPGFFNIFPVNGIIDFSVAVFRDFFWGGRIFLLFLHFVMFVPLFSPRVAHRKVYCYGFV